MKIISGIYKGRNILGYDIDGTRPTMERVKESLFGMIQEELPGKTILDLFSGSGNLGFEAISEGAEFAYLCDVNKKAVEIMKKNKEQLGLKKIEIFWMDYQKCLERLQERKIKLHVIFLDPPYKSNAIEKSIDLITNYNLLEEDGIIVCESNLKDRIQYPDIYTIYKERKYGDKLVVILKKI